MGGANGTKSNIAASGELVSSLARDCAAPVSKARSFRLALVAITLLVVTLFGDYSAAEFPSGSDVSLRHDPPAGQGTFSIAGSARPLEFEGHDERTKRLERGLGYPALLPGKLVFGDAGIERLWADPTGLLHFRRGDQIGLIADPDLDAELASERGRLAPLWAEFEAMQRVKDKNPEAMSSLLLMLKEGEAVLLEASIREREMERTLMRAVVSPADAEIIEGTRHSVNINPGSGDLFRYYPLSHLRFQVRLPLSAWGPDWTLRLEVNQQPAKILKIYSADLDETNEQWLLGIEFQPSRSFASMNEPFDYRLTTEPPVRQNWSQGLALHPPSCALAGRRRTYPLTAPKISGLVSFTKSENMWVEQGEPVGGVTLDGMPELLDKVSAYRSRAGQFIDEVETNLIPAGVVAENDLRLNQLRQDYAQAGRLVERASGMAIEAKETGLLVGTLDYQGPLTAGNANLAAHIKSPYVELLDVLVSKRVDVQDGDVVLVQLPSGSERLAKVFQIVTETIGAMQDLKDVQRISVLVYSPQFSLGEEPSKRAHDPSDAVPESSMPVYVRIPAYADDAERERIQGRLRSAFEWAQQQPPPDVPLYPIRFTFRSSPLSPLEKMAYMQRANSDVDGQQAVPRGYLQLLTDAIIHEQNPESRWTAYRRMMSLKFTSSFEPFVELAVRGQADVSSASLFHLSEKRRPFELFDALRRFQGQRVCAGAAAGATTETSCALCYQLLRGLIDYADPESDALTHLVRQGRLNADFQRQLDELFGNIIRAEGVNAPASIRILRGEERAGHPFIPEDALQRAVLRTAAGGDSDLQRVYERELARRQLLGISRNSKYGYGAAFIESGFLYQRDLQKIDALVRSRQNYLHDFRFLESSPNWTESLLLDPAVVQVYCETQALPDSVGPLNRAESCFQGFEADIEFAAFRQLTKPERSQMIGHLSAKRDYITLVLLLRDPFIRSQHAGDILDWLLLTPEARLELARYYSQCGDATLLDQIDRRQFRVEVLADADAVIRQLEQGALVATSRSDVMPTTDLQPISPATVHSYQQLLLALADRTPDPAARFGYLAAWMGLLPSAFELSDDASWLYAPWQAHGATRDEVAAAIRYVRQRRALKHAVAREREKRAENHNVEIRPGAEETLLRKVLEQVEAGMPPLREPQELLLEMVNSYEQGSTSSDSMLALRDTVRLVRLRDQEFATGRRERLQFQDIAKYAARIVFAPLFLLAFLPLVWLGNAIALFLQSLRRPSCGSLRSFRDSLRFPKKLLQSIEDGNPVKREIASWFAVLENDSLNVDRLVRLQERVKRIMNYRDIVYHVAVNGVTGKPDSINGQNDHGPDSLHPDVTIKLAPCLTLLALFCRMTAERIALHAERESGEGKRMYCLMEWFLQRSAYFSGYRYTLNPLANHQIAETYIWQSIPRIEFGGPSLVLWIPALPLNALIGLANLFGRIFLSLPMRVLYLFAPISLAGSLVFQASLRRLVIRSGNRLEENLYPDPQDLMQRTREKLRTGWTSREALPDQPGGRFVFSFRRIATRVLPFVIITTIVSGGFPYLYEILTGDGLNSIWNIRSTGIYAAFAALFLLSLTMVLHWVPLLSGWIPFAHLRNLNAIRLLRRRARRKMLVRTDRVFLGDLQADDELRRLNFEDAMTALWLEREAATPLLDMVVLMVEAAGGLDQYRRLAKSLVNERTAVLAFATSESMDGGGARLATLKTIQESYPEIRARNPSLPERFEATRSYFMPIGKDCDPLIEMPVKVTLPVSPGVADAAPLTPFVLALANVQALMRNSFEYQQDDGTGHFVGSITASPQRLYIGPHNVDQGGRFRGGITLVGAFESLDSAGRQGSLVVMGDQAFIRSSTGQLRNIIQNDAELSQWLDPLNDLKRQLPVGQLVIERFRTADRYGRHIATCVRYINEIQAIRNDLLALGPLSDRDVSDEEFLNGVAIHYMRHLIVPWFIAFQGGSLDSYRSSVLTGTLGVRDRRRMFHQRVLELIELFQEEGQLTRRQLPKVRFVNAPTARILYAKTAEDLATLWKSPRSLFPVAGVARSAVAREVSLNRESTPTTPTTPTTPITPTTPTN